MSPEAPVALISGGSRGFGQALVEARLAAGDIVATYSRSPGAWVERRRAEDPSGDRFYWEAVDGRDLAAVRKFAMNVIRRFGRIDTLVNNAGTGIEGLLTMTPEKDISAALTLNLESAIVLTRASLKGMLSARRGSIINISSVNAVLGHNGLSVYSATKAALIGFTKSLAREVGPQGISVNAVAPGFFDSDMVEHLSDAQRARIIRRTPMRRLCSIEDLVSTVEFLIATRSITGQTLVVDGGFSC